MVMCILPYNRIIQEGNVPKLCSLSKLFERCLLELMECGPLEGNFHYSFRANHSTVTAMLEIQSEIAENLDKGKSTLMYSTDLSAAFDLLCPGILMNTIKNKLPFQICRIIGDFLTGRSYKVKLGDSAVIILKRL